MQPALQLALLLAILLPACKIAASLFSRLGIPPILGELLMGVVLGPGALNLLHLRLFDGGQATGALMLLAQLGGLVLMFVAGIETDIDRMREASVTAFLVALSGVIWPFFLGAAIGHLLGLSWQTATHNEKKIRRQTPLNPRRNGRRPEGRTNELSVFWASSMRTITTRRPRL